MQKKNYWSINHNQKNVIFNKIELKNSFRKKYNDNEIKRYIQTYIVDYKNINLVSKIESSKIINIEKRIEILITDFKLFEIFESKKIKKISFIFLIDFEIMNEFEIIIINLINRFFSYCFDFHFQSKIVFFIN